MKFYWTILIIAFGIRGFSQDFQLRVKNATPLSVAFSPDGKSIIASDFGNVRMWNIATSEFQDFPLGVKIIVPPSVAFSSDGQFIIAGDFGYVRLWKAN